MSVPADTELAAMLIPSCARANAEALMNTPTRAVVGASASSRIWDSRSSGFQIVVSKMTVEDEETTMPMKDVIAKPRGMVTSCGQRASLGWLAGETCKVGVVDDHRGEARDAGHDGADKAPCKV